MAKVMDAVDQALEEMPVKNLRAKLAYLRERIPKVEKKGTAPEKMGGYTFMKAEDVCGDIGDLMCLMGISMVPTKVNIVSHQIVDGRASHVVLTVAYRFLDADSEEFIDIEAAGEGKDFGDKAVPKALTGAKKYALTQALTMRVGDDSEADDLTKHQTSQPAPKTAPAGAPAPTAPPRSGGKSGILITRPQANRMFAIAKGDTELIRTVQSKFGYAKSGEIDRADYDSICSAIEAAKKGGTEPVTNEEDINW